MPFWKKDEVDAFAEANPDAVAGLNAQEIAELAEKERKDQESTLRGVPVDEIEDE